LHFDYVDRLAPLMIIRVSLAEIACWEGWLKNEGDSHRPTLAPSGARALHATWTYWTGRRLRPSASKARAQRAVVVFGDQDEPADSTVRRAARVFLCESDGTVANCVTYEA
jgi:hypothetical protein